MTHSVVKLDTGFFVRSFVRSLVLFLLLFFWNSRLKIDRIPFRILVLVPAALRFPGKSGTFHLSALRQFTTGLTGF